MRLRQLVVIPRRGGISGQRQLVRQFDARIKLRIIRAEIRIQHSRQQNHAVELTSRSVSSTLERTADRVVP